MMYECAYCHKLCDSEDGVMALGNVTVIMGNNHMYAFKCKNCMSEKGKKLFEKKKKLNK